MNKPIKRFALVLSVFALMMAGGCKDDILPEVTSLDVSRLFSPTNLDARVVNQTSVRLNWRLVKNATSYTIEIFENAEEDFTGIPVRTLENVTYSQLPVVVPGFEGETAYSVRVKAVGEGIQESLWITGRFITDPEQIFFPVDPEEITAFEVTLRWPAGEFATHIFLIPGDINRPVTSAEVEAGVAVISGLESETEYVARLMNGTSTRGTAVFTTLIDMSGAITVHPEDDLLALVEAANEGDVFTLMPGEYVIEGNININTSLSIAGALPHDRPVVRGVVFRMKAGSGLRLKDVIFDGANSPDGNQLIVYDEAGTYNDLIVEDCKIINNVKGIIYVNVGALIESVTYKGNIIADVECLGGDFIDFRQGMTKKFVFLHNTVYNSALNRDLFRMDAGGSGNFPSENSIITIENNTFYNIISTDGTTRRVLYIRLTTHEITVKKNLFASTLANYSNQSATTVVEMSGNNYHSAPNLYSSEFTVHDSGNYTTLNPGFVNPAAGNFTVTNEELKLNGIGDPRWLQ